MRVRGEGEGEGGVRGWEEKSKSENSPVYQSDHLILIIGKSNQDSHLSEISRLNMEITDLVQLQRISQ